MKLSDLFTVEAPKKFVRSTFVAKLFGLASVTGIGKSREEALDNLLERIRAGLDGDYTPHLIVFKQHVAMIWRDTDRWYYTIQPIDHNGRIRSNFHGYQLTEYLECVRGARKHLAQYAEDTCKITEECASIIVDDGDRAEYIRLSYQTKEALALMEEYKGITFHEALEILDGIKRDLAAYEAHLAKQAQKEVNA